MARKYKLFISWSGVKEKRCGELIGNYINSIFTEIEPWYSQNIRKGTLSHKEIISGINMADAGIVCISKENVKEPWINFEGGALFNRGNIFTTTLLLDIKPKDIRGPLSMYQHTEFTKEDLRKYLHMLPWKLLGKLVPFPRAEHIDKFHQELWPTLSRRIKMIMKTRIDKTGNISPKVLKYVQNIESYDEKYKYKYGFGTFELKIIGSMEDFDALCASLIGNQVSVKGWAFKNPIEKNTTTGYVNINSVVSPKEMQKLIERLGFKLIDMKFHSNPSQ